MFTALPFVIKTVGAPAIGVAIYASALALIAQSPIAATSYFLIWFVGVWYLASQQRSWRFVGTFAVVLGGCAMAVSGHSGPQALVLGMALHSFYALSKIRCATIGCCNFHWRGCMGRGTTLRALHLARAEIFMSLALASVCAFGLTDWQLESTWIWIGFVAHGCVRGCAWLLRYIHPALLQSEGRALVGGLDLLIVSVVVQIGLH